MADTRTTGSTIYSKADGVALEHHLEALIEEKKCYLEALIHAVEKTAEQRATDLRDKLSGMNEIREAMRDQSSRFATRSELDLQAKRISDELALRVDRFSAEIADLKEYRATMEGKASQQSVNVAMLMSGIGLLIGLASLILGLFGK